MSDPAPPLPRVAVLGLSVLTIVVVGALSLALFWSDLVEDDAPGASVPAPVGDDFDRADGALGDGWTEVVGTWAVQDGHAALTGGGDGQLAGLATSTEEVEDGHVTVTATAVEPGWGLAFRVQDAENLWALVANGDVSAWSLAKLTDGTPEVVATIATTPRDGSVVEVDLLDDRIQVTIDGEAADGLDDPALADAAGVGLLALPGGSLASMAWDDLTISAG